MKNKISIVRWAIVPVLFACSSTWAFTDFRLFDEYTMDARAEAKDQPTLRGLYDPRAIPGRNLFTAPWVYAESQMLASYAYSNAKPVRLLNTGAVTNPLLREINGIQLSDGHWGTLGNRSYLRVFDLFEIQSDVYFRPRQNHESFESDSLFFANELYAGLKIHALQIQAGKIRSNWGVGRINHVLFSNEAEAMWKIRLTNQEPVQLPWFLKYLGDVRFEAFWGFLDERQTFPNGYMIGTYFTAAPTKRFEIGLGQSVMFGGKGAPTNDPIVYLSEGFLPEVKNPTNRNFLASARYRIPGIEIEPYVEWLLEDCCPKFPNRFFAPRNSVHQLGVFFPQVGPQEAKTDLTFEWFRSSHIAYRHNTYKTGYIYRSKLLGPTFGPEGTGVSLRLRHTVDPSLRFYFDYSHELRGKLGQAISFGPDRPITDVDPAYEAPEERNRLEIGCEKKWKSFEMLVGLGADRANHEGYVLYDANRYHWFGTVALRHGL